MKEPWLVVATKQRPFPNHKMEDTVGVTVVDCGQKNWMTLINDFGDAVGAHGLSASKIRGRVSGDFCSHRASDNCLCDELNS